MNKYKILGVAFGIILGAAISQTYYFPIQKGSDQILGWALVVIFFIPFFSYKNFFLFICAFFYGFTSLCLSQDHFEHSAWRIPGKIIVLSGKVASFPEKAGMQWKWEFELNQFRMEESVWQPTSGRVEIIMPAEGNAPLIGDYAILKGVIRFPNQDTYGGKWMRKTLFLKGLLAQIRVKKTGDIIFTNWDFLDFHLRSLQLIREAGIARIDKIYSKKQKGIMKALLLGCRIDETEMRSIFSKTGTSHLLSVSGFHTAVVAGIIFSLLILCRLSPQKAVFGAGLVTLAYMGLTGWGVAVQRAGMMAILVWAAWALGRPQALLYWLNMALVFLLWSNPQKLWDISFQLSFLSMYGIILISPFIKSKLPIPGLDVSLGAFLATYPMVMYYFQNFSWSGIFANLIAVPIFALILPLGFFSMLPVIGLWALLPTQSLLSIVLWMLEKTSELSWGCLVFPQPHWAVLLGYYFSGGLLLWFGRHRGALPSSAAC